MMGVLHRARLAIHRLGIDVSRYPNLEPMDCLARLQMDLVARLLREHSVDVVVDVGANSGQYAEELRRGGFTRRIVSFEPLHEPFSILKSKTAADPLWSAHQFAIGNQNGIVTLNVAANEGASSSVLPMLETHVKAAPQARYIGTEEAQIRTLDSLASKIGDSIDRVFLKVDVQGYERHVLAGADAFIRRNCVGLQAELSLVPLYEGSMLYRETLDIAEEFGFSLMSLIPGLIDIQTGRLLQADGVFLKEK